MLLVSYKVLTPLDLIYIYYKDPRLREALPVLISICIFLASFLMSITESYQIPLILQLL